MQVRFTKDTCILNYNLNVKKMVTLFRKLTSFFFLFGIVFSSISQIKIGDNPSTTHGSTVLEIESTNKGVLIPRIALTGALDVTTIATPAISLLIFNTSNAGSTLSLDTIIPGYHYWNGTRWLRLVTEGSNSWDLTGNAGTIAGTNFVGTVDDQDFILKRNNVQSGWLNDSLQNTALGVGSLPMSVTGEGNTALGHRSLTALTTGEFNTSVGANSLIKNTVGSFNTALGGNTLTENISGIENTASGAYSLHRNTTGSYNSAIGSYTLQYNTTGDYNTASGWQALEENTIGSRNTAMGTHAYELSSTGSDNVAVGHKSLRSARAGNNNTALGAFTLENIVNGSNNVAIGKRAGINQTAGDNNIIIGYNQNTANLTGDNQLNLGGVLFGTDLTGNQSAPAGKLGVLTTAPTSSLHVNGSVSHSVRKEVTSTATLGDNDYVLIFNGPDNTIATPYIATLPVPTSCGGRMYKIIWGAGTSTDRYISFSEVIHFDDGSVTLSVGNTIQANSNQYGTSGSVTLQSDGTNWWFIGR